MKKFVFTLTLFLTLFTLAVSISEAFFEADDFYGMEGYYILANTHVNGTFNGVDFGTVVKMENGMLFEFNEYHYMYAYRPAVVVLVKPINSNTGIYKLIIKDHLYGRVTRLR